MIDLMTRADCFVSSKSSHHLRGFVVFCRGLRNIYFVVCSIFSRSTALIFSERYSFTFSLLIFVTPTVNAVMSESAILSLALSKKRIVKIRKLTMTTERNMTANVGLIERTKPEMMSPQSDPAP